MKKMCMLEENKICDNCLECNTCDIDSSKMCDNCAKCIDTGLAYKTVEIDDIIFTEDLKRKFRLIETRLRTKHQG
ncbi:MAG: hypothetical protein ACYC21_07480 [Eubacteriales bacterium]